MSKEKQIDQKKVVQMARDICIKRDKPENCKDCDVMWCKAQLHAFRAYEAGYRKPSDGEWVVKFRSTFPQYEPSKYECSICGFIGTVLHKYCPNCGAKMDGKEKI